MARPSGVRVQLLALALLALPVSGFASAGRYLELDEYLASVFPLAVPRASNLVVSRDLRAAVEAVSGARFTRLRIRYWSDGQTTAWVLDEVGKTEPITIGVSVTAGRVGGVQVLEFRESRGWEIRFPFFTDQFAGAGLAGGRELDRAVDGITGATLSVAAMNRAVKLALVLDRWVRHQSERYRAPNGGQ